MKTILQITNKIKQLKNKLSKKAVRENFGDKEQRQLDDFIGNTYDYSYDDRLMINSIVNVFHDWCGNYTGSCKKNPLIIWR